MGLVGAVADLLQTGEDGLRLLLSILAGYPLAAIYRTIIYKQSVQTQRIFLVAVGIALYVFNNGYQVYHALLSTLFAYSITNYLPGTVVSIFAAHTMFLGHLLIGYWFAESAKYDITWTTPFCIMCLRYIGVVMDVYDGHHPMKDKSEAKREKSPDSITDKPSLLEIAAFGFHFTGTFVGPQFSLRRFRQFVNGDFLDEKTKEVRQSSLMPSLGRFVAGVTYMVLHQWGSVWIPNQWFASEEYMSLSFFWRWTWITLWYRLTMMRYCAAWLLTEGAAILCGLGYNGKDKKNEDRWDGVRDLHITGWELGLDFNDVVKSFNVGTNTFAKNHLFRRMRFLGSKSAAHLATLMYLAVWHGYHLGYFILFFYELVVMRCMEMYYHALALMPSFLSFISRPWMRPFVFIYSRIVVNYTMSFGFITFGFVKKEIWWAPLKSLYFIGYIMYFFVIPAGLFFLLRVLRKHHHKKEKKTEDSHDEAPVEAKKEL